MSETRYLLAYHEQGLLDSCPAPEGTIRMNLNRLPIPKEYQRNAFCESRALLTIALNPDPFLNSAHYLGLFQASYHQKFPELPSLTTFPTGTFWGEAAPFCVYGPVVGPDYLDQCEVWHPGMRKCLENILRMANVKISNRPTVFCNSFIAHTSTWAEFLPAWLRMFLLAQDFFDKFSPTPGGDPSLAPAYLLERLTSAWFAQAKVQCIPIYSPTGRNYLPAYERKPTTSGST